MRAESYISILPHFMMFIPADTVTTKGPQMTYAVHPFNQKYLMLHVCKKKRKREGKGKNKKMSFISDVKRTGVSLYNIEIADKMK